MADFLSAVELVLFREGSLSDDPFDRGGITNWGITLPVLREMGELGDVDGDGDVDPSDIRQLTRKAAAEVYRKLWWDRFNYESIPSPDVAHKVFDMAVNFGPTQGHRIAQRSCRAVGLTGIQEDGRLGPISLAALRSLSGGQAFAWVVSARSESAGVYRAIAVRHPEMGRFLLGWLRRAYDEWS